MRNEILGKDKYTNAMIIGKILRRWREKQGIMQKTVADELDYRNPNYISMLESGRTTVPMARIADIIKAYKIPSSFGLVILRGLYPETFEMAFQIVEMTKAASVKSATSKANEIAGELVEELNLKGTISLLNADADREAATA